MELRNRLRMLIVVLLLAVAACGSDGTQSNTGSDGPSITESETGRVVGQAVGVEAFRVEVTEEGTAVFVVSGSVPSPCHEAVYGFEEPDNDGVMVGTAESWFDRTCTLAGGATAFSKTMELTTLEPGEYVARLDGELEAHFTIPPADGGAADATELRVKCGQVELGDPTDVHLPDTMLDVDEAAALDEAIIAAGAEPELFSMYSWSVAVREEERLVLFGRASDEAPASEVPYADAELVLTDTGWSPTSWGQCRLVVDAPGFGPAAVVLDPSNEPNPTSTDLHVLINERACASGQAPNGREVVPVVVADKDRLVITVLVEPVSGSADCPSNPWHPITITLDEPLRNRQVLDGSTVPAVSRPWPPTPDSINE